MSAGKVVDSNVILKSTINSAGYAMIFQIFFRVISFSINGIFLHHVEKDVLGIINVRLVLLFTTILFVSREAFRRACLSNTRNHNWPQVVNLLWMMVPNMIFWSCIFSYIWLNWLELPSDDKLDDYRFAVYMTALGCMIEGCVEPIYLFSQAFLYSKLKLAVDTAILITRIGLSTLTVLYAPRYTIQAFAYGTLFGSVIMVLIYTIFFHFQFQKKCKLLKNREEHLNDPLLALPLNSLYDFLPRRIEGQTFIDHNMAILTWGFFKQGLLKQLLTEGERYIMTIFSVLSFAEQGIFDVVNNIGSLAARFLFLPIEENSYFYFAQMLHRDSPISKQPKDDVESAARVLRILLKGLSLLGLIILVFGFSYSHLLLSLYGGRTLTDGSGPLLLRTHCLCVLLLGINGVTEAYLFAAMNKNQLDSHNRVLIGLTAIFLGLSWLLSRLFGGIGFILANCVNMSLRITYSSYFIQNRYHGSEQNPLQGLIPSKGQLVAFFGAFVITGLSEKSVYPSSAILHVLIGAVCGLGVLAAILFTEPELSSYILDFLRKKIIRRKMD